MNRKFSLAAIANGPSCYKYVTALPEMNLLSISDQENLFDILTAHYYSNDVIAAACFTARVEEIWTYRGFEEVLTEVHASFRDYG